ncbi:type I-E CRISPR-associated protein Cas7/Cse4/CasC [Ligilactobacillus saerimneri]|uniref:Type I-E CRISPR-associated protein Cas7/Cse4/CasC n=1 Tax=Ligilactobacillus saerimneri TaxID=228229 RepID=A0A7H9EM76_9LACO|nr:type I-E CRISPR-associated protein Cas7/Cse4/CasC [Ligilactobacillus saerimneri]QLL78305.1 type I-E CRISPR-associated protein Cas7/Cse4/CasC [Ligilactobacillus saerimneri]
MNKNLYLCLHALQTVPPANLNRDDTGAPKSATYGGALRARVSSQSWKRAMRQYFAVNGRANATRTKKIPTILAEKINTLNPELASEEALEKAKAILAVVGIKKYEKNNIDTKVLLAVSPGQLEKLAKYSLEHEELDKKEIKQILQGDDSLDLALFGRMVADDPELNVEATAQVAHALSTNEITPEFDYYTAIDDLQSEDTSGASMLGDIEYNSSTLYRYANVNVRELIADLGEKDALAGINDFIKSFILSMPTGKQNTFANKTVPGYVMATVHSDTPVNLVSAFETPVRSRQGYMEQSIEKLEQEYDDVQQFIEKPLAQIILRKGTMAEGNKVNNLSELLERVADVLNKAVVDDENING